MRTSTLLGSYVPGRTPVHGLDARVKLLALVALGVALFASEVPYGLVMPAIAVIVGAFLAGLSARDILRALRPSALLLAFGLLACAFVADGTADIVLVGQFGVSCQGAARGLFAAVRIVVIIAGSLVMTTTTTPSEVADALSSLMAPFGILGLPVGGPCDADVRRASLYTACGGGARANSRCSAREGRRLCRWQPRRARATVALRARASGRGALSSCGGSRGCHARAWLSWSRQNAPHTLFSPD